LVGVRRASGGGGGLLTVQGICTEWFERRGRAAFCLRLTVQGICTGWFERRGRAGFCRRLTVQRINTGWFEWCDLAGRRCSLRRSLTMAEGEAWRVVAECKAILPRMNADKNIGAGGWRVGWHFRTSRHRRSCAAKKSCLLVEVPSRRADAGTARGTRAGAQALPRGREGRFGMAGARKGSRGLPLRRGRGFAGRTLNWGNVPRDPSPL
jgi:hypothetical protein